MERIDPIIQPVPAAGTDPGFIPGLMAPRPTERDDEAAPEKAEETAEEAGEEATAEAAETAEAPDDASDETADDAADEAAEVSAGETAAPDGEAAVGPVFEISDRRASIAADRTGFRFQLDGEQAEFRWDEVGAVEVDVPRFGRRFTVTVHTGPLRWYQLEIDAPARSSLKTWEAELDTVLDAYFEEG